MPSAAYSAKKARRLFSVGNGLRLISSAIVAYATAYRNVAFAGPAGDPQAGRMDPSSYSEPIDAACAQAGPRAEGRCVVVRIDHLRRLPLDRPVGTLLVGNPAIADATLISSTEAVLTAKSVGTTNMIFLDREGVVIADLEIMVQEGAQRRVMLRRGPVDTANYQCAPRCERTLSLSDSVKAHADLTGLISSESAMSYGAADGGAVAPVLDAAPEESAPSGGLSTGTIPGQ